MHALFDALVGFHRHAQKLDAITELGGGIQIGRRDRRNAFAIDGTRVDPGAERQARQDGKLLRGVVALHVERGIGLRIAEPLRFLQAIGEAQPLLLHAREDVVTGAVENPVDAVEGRAVEAFAERFYDRNAAGDRRFEIKRHAAPLGERGKLLPVRGKERLVGRDHRLAGGERGLNRKLSRTRRSADHLDQYVDCRVARQRHGIADPTKFPGIESSFLVARACADRDDLDAAPAARQQFIVSVFQKLHDSAADSAKSGKTDFQRQSHNASSKLR